MKIIIFGATGMVGQGVLRECLLYPRVESALSIARVPLRQKHNRLKELILPNVGDLAPHAKDLTDYDAAFFCLGVSVAGMTEAKYTAITYDLTLSAARTLSEINSAMVFTYVSGASTDSTEKGSTMWARVKGKTENAILRLPFKAKYMFRPAYIHPVHGEKPKVPTYALLYAFIVPLYPLLKKLMPSKVNTTEVLGRAMLAVVSGKEKTQILEVDDINRLGQKTPF